MQRRDHFGRRAAPQRIQEPRRPRQAPAAAPLPAAPAEALGPVAEHLDLYAGEVELNRELADWKATRKLKRRSFREPWRSFSIAAGVAFALGIFILPDTVADIANTVTTGLFAVSVFMGWRRPRD